jgi:hypothetical protein
MTVDSSFDENLIFEAEEKIVKTIKFAKYQNYWENVTF